MADHGIEYLYLGSFLDQLLNDECRLSDAGSTEPGRPGGIRIPREDEETGELKDPGSGNIVIMGGPGTGKTTLALHMANACCARPDNRRFLAAYFSLEEPFYRLKTKAEAFGWHPVVQRMRSVEATRHPPTNDQLGNWLFEAVKRAQQRVDDDWGASDLGAPLGGFMPQPLLVPSLSPANMESDQSGSSVFWERFRQLERFLDAAKQMRKMDLAQTGFRYPSLDLRLVVLDSLTVFGGRLLTRDELSRLFALFSRTQTIGVFIVEDKSAFSAAQDEQHMETIDSLADVVIRLRSSREHGYFRRNMEIAKSRYTHNILGVHGVRIAGKESSSSTRNWTPPRPARQGCRWVPCPAFNTLYAPSTGTPVRRPARGTGDGGFAALFRRIPTGLSSAPELPP
jgi:KaiC/GvpD/RAD55 family RecA-like ATPase